MIIQDKKFSPEEISKKIKQTAFEYYRNSDFPYIKLRDFEIWQEFLALKNLKNSLSKGILNTGTIAKSHIGQKICYNFMPHEWTVKCAGRALAPVDAFKSEKWLERMIRLAHDYDRISNQTIRTFSKTVNAQFAANFPPSVCKDICNNYLGRDQIFYDFSSGFGGRLVGFLASDFAEMGARYIGIEPSTKTYIGLLNIIEFFDAKDMAYIHRECAEDFCPEELIGKVQLAFSSPPYFNREVYSCEDTQSCNKFTTWETWLQGFWFPTISNCCKLLKPNGYFIANINNIKINKNTEYKFIEETLEYCKTQPLQRLPDLYLHMSGFGANMNKKKKEIFLVFQKQGTRRIKRRK